MYMRTLLSIQSVGVIIVSALVAVLFGTAGSALATPGAVPTNPTANGEMVDSTITIDVTGSNLEFEQEEIQLEAGTTVTLQLDNSESSMPHNVVLVNSDEAIRPVGIAAVQAQQNDYIPEDEENRILGYTSLAAPGETVEFTFEVPPPGEYPYICTYPGHFQTMQGTLISVESL